MKKLLCYRLLFIFSYSTGTYVIATCQRLTTFYRFTPKDLTMHLEFSPLTAKKLCLIDDVLHYALHHNIDRPYTVTIPWVMAMNLHSQALKTARSKPTMMNRHRFLFIADRVARLRPLVAQIY